MATADWYDRRDRDKGGDPEDAPLRHPGSRPGDDRHRRSGTAMHHSSTGQFQPAGGCCRASRISRSSSTKTMISPAAP